MTPESREVSAPGPQDRGAPSPTRGERARGTRGTPRLPHGVILSVADAAGLELDGDGDKRSLRCPFHDDANPSAFVHADNYFSCSVCYPGDSLSAKEFAEQLGVPWPLDIPRPRAPRTPDALNALGALGTPRHSPTFTPAEARSTWNVALERARDDARVEADAGVYAYLERRGLSEAWEEGAFGVMPNDPSLPAAVRWWRSESYAIVAPLYDSEGRLWNVQARAIVDRQPKVMTPKGSKLAGLAFANRSALRLLRGEEVDHDVVILGEGLTDALALQATSAVPVLCSPGTSTAASCIGRWAQDRTILVATDRDAAGDAVVARLKAKALQRGARRVVRVRWPRGAKDACDVVAQRGLRGLAAFLERIEEEARRA